MDVNNWNWLNRHRIQDKIIFPAAGYVKFILEAASNYTSGATLELSEIKFKKMLLLSESSNSNNSFNLTVSSELKAGQFNCHIARLSGEDGQQVFHSQAKFAGATFDQPSMNLKSLVKKCTDTFPSDEIHRKLSMLGLEGDYPSWSYTLLAKISDTEALVNLTSENQSTVPDQHLIHPSLLDLCFRASAILIDMDQLYIPKKIEKLIFWGGDTNSVYCHMTLHSKSERTIELDLDIADEHGSIIASVSQLTLKTVNVELANARRPIERPVILEPSFAFHQNMSRDAPLFGDETNLFLPNSIAYDSRLADLEERTRSDETISSLLSDLTVHNIGRTLKQLGFPIDREQCSLSQIEQICQIDIDQKSQFYALLVMLEHRQLIDISRKFCAAQRYIDANASVVKVRQDIPSNPELVLEEIFGLHDTWDYTNELRLIDLCGRNLGSVLKGCKTGIGTLFPDGAVIPLQGLYEFSPTCRPSIEILVGLVEGLLRNWQSTRKCRILEIGGGTGALLSQLVPILGKHPVEYTFTDISRSFVRLAKERFSGLKFLEFQTFDIDSSYEVQGFSANTYDIVLANDVLHLSRDIQSAVRQIQDILLPGGRFHFIELTREPDWASLVFGMLRDWWHRTDDIRQPVSPCNPAEFWEDQLAFNGFNSIESTGNSVLPHTVFVAESKKDIALLAPARPVESLDRALIFSGSDTYSAEFIDSLECRIKSAVSPGADYSSRHQSYKVRTDKLEDYVRLVEELRSTSELPNEIILLWNFLPLHSSTPFDGNVDSLSSTLVSISHLFRAYDQLDLNLPLITLITANVHQISKTADIESCLNSTLWSVGRTIRNEFPETSCRLIDIDPTHEDQISELCRFVQNRNENLEAVLRQSGWLAPIVKYSTPENTNQPIEIRCYQPGNISKIQPVATVVPDIKSTELLIQVSAAALNFRDVMITLNALPEYAIKNGVMQDSLGMECAGKVVKIGSQVEGFSLGDDVVALVPGSMGSLVTARSELARKIPVGWSFEQIAGIPAAYITASSCLEHLRELKPGMSVLIHSASGGVGLALIHLLRNSGVTVYATVGSREKVEFLNLLGIVHVANSRSTSFVGDVKEWNCNQGVDLIVNTLAGKLASANAKLLKPDGVFVELGKYPAMSEVHETIMNSNPNVSIRTIDIDNLWKVSPEKLADRFHTTMKKAEQGFCPALPRTVFSHRNAKEAFRYMANAKHIGKVILKFEHPFISVDFNAPISSEATYLVAGGTRGFGLATVRWLCDVGARHIIVVGRNPDQSDQFRKLKIELENYGVVVQTIATDITELTKLRVSVDKSVSDNPPIKGIFHCAMEIQDRMITNLDVESCQMSLRTKVLGAWNLYKATEHLQLDFFALYSSATSIIGPPGQVAYSSANAFLDSFAKFLRTKGISAISINWGAVSDYGYLADNQKKLTRSISRYGIRSLPAKSMLAPLGGILKSDSVSQLIVSGGNWPQSIRESPRVDIKESIPGNENRQNVKSKGSANFDRESCEQIVLSCFSKVLEIPLNSIEPSESVLNLGVDSLLAVELSNLLRSEGKLQISATDLLQSITIRDIIESQTQANS